MEQGILSRAGWSLIDDSQRHVLTPDGSEWEEWIEARPEGDRQDLYLFAYGHDYKQALADYTLVAGRAPMPPKYTLGYWWSRYWQYSDNEFVDLVNKLKSMDVPIDVLIVDMDWHETWACARAIRRRTNTVSASAGRATRGRRSCSPRPRTSSSGPRTKS